MAIAHILLDTCALVQGEDQGECQGKRPIDYAQALKGVPDREKRRLIQRLKQLMQVPANRCLN